MALSEARKRANAKYKAKHPGKQKIYVARSTARKFIKDYASVKDLDELSKLMDARRNELKGQYTKHIFKVWWCATLFLFIIHTNLNI